jgi:IclR family acetate operon transcriptional repressor
MDMKDSLPVKSASRVLQVFEAFAEAGRTLSLAEIARTLDIPRSSCLALLRTLASSGYLYQVGPNDYYPTRKLFVIAEVIARKDPITRRVLPAMTALRDRTKETVILSSRYEDKLVYILVVESEQMSRISAREGIMKPLTSTASGKVLLGALGEEERAAPRGRRNMTATTHRTITNVKDLEEDIRAGLARGWQYNRGENIEDVIAIGAPVDINGEVHAMIVTGPIHRMISEVERHAEALVEACCRIESQGMAEV